MDALDKYQNPKSFIGPFQMRKPSTNYMGRVYFGYNKQITYPEDAVIPEQTDIDREMLPKFVIVGVDTLTTELEILIHDRSMEEYNQRNVEYIKSKNNG